MTPMDLNAALFVAREAALGRPQPEPLLRDALVTLADASLDRAPELLLERLVDAFRVYLTARVDAILEELDELDEAPPNADVCRMRSRLKDELFEAELLRDAAPLQLEQVKLDDGASQ